MMGMTARGSRNTAGGARHGAPGASRGAPRTGLVGEGLVPARLGLAPWGAKAREEQVKVELQEKALAGRHAHVRRLLADGLVDVAVIGNRTSYPP